jgi:hypothetical protein
MQNTNPHLNKSYREIVEDFQTACQQHLGIATFDHGPLDYLDANAVNKEYPYVYLRPVASPGLSAKVKTFSFELFSLDVPKLSDESPLDVYDNTERFIYDLLAYFNFGPGQRTYEVEVTGIAPVNEAFQDRVFGWVANINVEVPFVLDYCDYPRI